MAFSKNGFVYTPWVVITAPIQDNAFERVLKELGTEDRVELVTPDPSGGAIFKNAQGKYVPMPPFAKSPPLRRKIICRTRIASEAATTSAGHTKQASWMLPTR